MKSRQIQSLFLIALIAFTATNIGTEASYLLKRLKSCSDLGKEDCDGQKGTYLFAKFRNLTMKFFCDCINLFIILVTLGLVNVLKKPAVPFIPRICFLMILILTLMSLGTGIRSVDQEDEYNQQDFYVNVPKACKGIQEAKAGIIEIQKKLAEAEDGLIQIQKGLEQAQSAVQNAETAQKIAYLKKQQIETKTMQAGGVKKLAEVKGLLIKATIGCKVGNEFIDIYQTYRNSVIGLVIVNFVIAYTVVLYSIFGWDNDGLQREKSMKVSQNGLEFKTTNNFKSEFEINAQNAV